MCEGTGWTPHLESRLSLSTVTKKLAQPRLLGAGRGLAVHARHAGTGCPAPPWLRVGRLVPVAPAEAEVTGLAPLQLSAE